MDLNENQLKSLVYNTSDYLGPAFKQTGIGQGYRQFTKGTPIAVHRYEITFYTIADCDYVSVVYIRTALVMFGKNYTKEWSIKLHNGYRKMFHVERSWLRCSKP